MNVLARRGEQQQRTVELVLVAHPRDRRHLLDERWLPSSLSMPAVISLGNQPGHSAFTRMPLRAHCSGQLAGEVDHGALRRAVVRLLDRRRADVTEHRGDVDDAARRRSRSSTARTSLRQVPDRGDVQLHHLRGSVSRSSSSTDTLWPMPALLTSTSTATEPLDRRRARRARGRRRPTGRRRPRRRRELVDQRREPVGPAGDHHDGRPDGVQHAGEPVAEARRGAGDDRDPTVEAEQCRAVGASLWTWREPASVPIRGQMSRFREKNVEEGTVGAELRQRGMGRTMGMHETTGYHDQSHESATGTAALGPPTTALTGLD